MLLSSGFTAGIALGLLGIGSVLSAMTTSSNPDAYSMTLALRGVGVQVWPVPVLLVAGALVVWVAPFVRSLLGRRRSSINTVHV